MDQKDFLNSITDPIVKLLLRSPLYKLADKNIVLIIYTGRKTGATHSEAVNYVKEGKTLHIICERNRAWWRNLRGGAAVKIILESKQYSGWADLKEDQESVLAELRKIFVANPQNAHLENVSMDQNGKPDEGDLSTVAKDRVAIVITYS